MLSPAVASLIQSTPFQLAPDPRADRVETVSVVRESSDVATVHYELAGHAGALDIEAWTGRLIPNPASEAPFVALRRRLRIAFVGALAAGLALAWWFASRHWYYQESPAAGGLLLLAPNLDDEVQEATIRRRYATRVFRQRLHQTAFRERVVHAYQHHCAVCRLKREELLEAAHIMPDADPLGEPSVPNGVALCRLHHAAFDKYLIGIRPDCVIEVRQDVLDESDGPMLIHGLQGFHGARLVVPRRASWRPDPRLLEERYERFRRSAV